MENKLVQRLLKQVNEVISSANERESLFSALKRYQSSSDVKGLVQDLKRVINEPQKLELYDYVRPLIRATHQQHYDKLAPSIPSQRLRVIRLRRRTNESLGFAVRGGYEYGIGVFVSDIVPGSQAELQGLRVGDEIVRVNGFTISEAIHEEVLNLIKGREEIELKVTNIGMLPIKQNPTDPITWQYVDKHGVTQSLTKTAQQGNTTGGTGETVKIFINLRGASSLGCSIVSGPKHFPGIFIESVKSGSLGEDYGLEVGDQLIEVNGTSFLDIKHKEATVELKGSKELNMVILKGAGSPLFDAKMAPKPSPKGSPVIVKKQAPPPPEPYKQKTEEDSGEIMCEILEEDQYAREEKRRWEQQQEAHRRARDLERKKEEEEEKRRQDEIREKEEKIEREKEEEKKRQAERERQKQQISPTNSDDKGIRQVRIKKIDNQPLDITLEGGMGSPLGGKIVVGEVFYDGTAYNTGEIQRGAQIVSIDGTSLLNVTLSKAMQILEAAEQDAREFITLELIDSDLAAFENENTYF